MKIASRKGRGTLAGVIIGGLITTFLPLGLFQISHGEVDTAPSYVWFLFWIGLFLTIIGIGLIPTRNHNEEAK